MSLLAALLEMFAGLSQAGPKKPLSRAHPFQLVVASPAANGQAQWVLTNSGAAVARDVRVEWVDPHSRALAPPRTVGTMTAGAETRLIGLEQTTPSTLRVSWSTPQDGWRITTIVPGRN